MNPLYLLLVEDDPDDIDLMQEALLDNDIPHKLDVLKYGDQVLPWLEACKHFPDVIVLDLNLPKMHGRDVLYSIKNSRHFQDIPVVVLSTSSAREDQDFCLQAGAERFLTKPSTIDGFAATTAAILAAAGRDGVRH